MGIKAHEATRVLAAKKNELLTLAATVEQKIQALDLAIQVLEEDAMGGTVEAAVSPAVAGSEDTKPPRVMANPIAQEGDPSDSQDDNREPAKPERIASLSLKEDECEPIAECESVATEDTVRIDDLANQIVVDFEKVMKRSQLVTCRALADFFAADSDTLKKAVRRLFNQGRVELYPLSETEGDEYYLELIEVNEGTSARLSSNQRKMLQTLVESAGDNHRAAMRYAEMVEKSGIPKGSIPATLSALANKGFITRERCGSAGGPAIFLITPSAQLS